MLDCGVVPRIIPFGQQGTLHNPYRLYCARGHSERNNLFNYYTISHSGLRQTETHICGTEFHPITSGWGFCQLGVASWAGQSNQHLFNNSSFQYKSKIILLKPN